MPRGDTTWASEIRWHPFKNDSGEAVPAWAALRIVGIDGNKVLYTCRKPNADGIADVVFNGPAEVPEGGHGLCTRDFPAFVLYDPADGLPAAGQVWGTKANSWKLRKGQSGFIIHGGAVAAEERVYVIPLGGATEVTGVARVTGTLVDGVYHISHLGDGTFNTTTRTFSTAKRVLVLDAARITIPDAP